MVRGQFWQFGWVSVFLSFSRALGVEMFLVSEDHVTSRMTV